MLVDKKMLFPWAEESIEGRGGEDGVGADGKMCEEVGTNMRLPRQACLDSEVRFLSLEMEPCVGGVALEKKK